MTDTGKAQLEITENFKIFVCLVCLTGDLGLFQKLQELNSSFRAREEEAVVEWTEVPTGITQK